MDTTIMGTMDMVTPIGVVGVTIIGVAGVAGVIGETVITGGVKMLEEKKTTELFTTCESFAVTDANAGISVAIMLGYLVSKF